MAFKEHRAFSVLPDGGGFADEHEPLSLQVNGRTVSVRLRYTEDDAATDGFPGLRLRWYFPGAPGANEPREALATVRIAGLTVPEGQTTAVMVERILIVHCEDLRGGDNAVTERSFEAPRDAYALKVEPFEAGDPTHPGELGVELGGVL